MAQLINKPQLNFEELKIAGLMFYKKLRMAYFYKPKSVYNGNVTLIKSTENFTDVNNDYGLSQVIMFYTYIYAHININFDFLLT